MALKLSDLSPDDIQSDDSSAPLKLSDLSASDVEPVQKETGDLTPQQKQEEWTAAQTLGQGALQGATLGFSDEIGGALGALMEKAADVTGHGTGDKKSLQELYQEYRDFQRSRNKAAEEAHPKTYLTGQVGGALGAALLAPEALAPASLAGQAALGAATGLGTSEAETVPGMAKDVALGTGLGLVGGAAGRGLSKALSPEALETTGSKLASKAVGIKPSKELATQWIQQDGKWIPVQGSDVIKGLGKTLSEEGGLPLTGGAENIYDKTLQAIDTNEQRLNPLFKSVQSKLDDQLPETLSDVGSIGEKTADFLDNFKNDLRTNPDADKIINNLNNKYGDYLQKLDDADGNLAELNKFKQDLQDKAKTLNKAAFDQSALTPELKPEAEFVKNLSGIVREHIEDLAESVDPEASKAISNTNQTLSRLYEIEPYTERLLNKPSTDIGMAKGLGGAAAALSTGHPLIAAGLLTGYGLEKATGQPISRLGQIGAAKATLGAAKALSTPAGQIVQEVLPASTNKWIVSPFSQEKVQHVANPSESTKLATNLYTATDNSLKGVADSLTKDPRTVSYGETLKNAIDTNNDEKKNQAIFLIIQNPVARKLITPEK